jgi:phage terminase small subunit
MAGLSNKQRAFVEYYLSAGFNAAEAARRAGYSLHTAPQQGARLLKKVDVAAAIEARVAELTMTPKEVLIRLTEQARFDVGDILTSAPAGPRQPTVAAKPADGAGALGGKDADSDNVPPKAGEDAGEDDGDAGDVCAQTPAYVRVDLAKAVALGKTRTIKRIKPTEWGLDIQFHDPQTALKLIGQAQGMFKDTLEVSGKNGGPIETAQVHIYIPDNGRGDAGGPPDNG